jgi:ferredoxin, 2Fe-2S
MHLRVFDRKGEPHDLTWDDGQNLMEFLRDQDLVLASCGGHCACGTCHVYLDEETMAKFPPRSADERAQLEYLQEFQESASRLSCQLRPPSGLARLSVRIAPDTF